MDQEKLEKQKDAINKAFHKLWFAIMFHRPDYKEEEIQKLSFIEMHLIGMACEHPELILKEIREYLKIPQTTLSSIIAKLEKMDVLKRVINPRDMRSFSLHTTELGRKIREKHKKQDEQMAQEIILSLEEDERDDFIRMFQKVANKIGAGNPT